MIDNFSPTGAAADVARTHRDAERLLRAQGNQAGRGRMRTGSNLRASYYPCDLTVFSAEDAPKVHSLQARILFVEVALGDLSLREKHRRTRARGFLYAAAMAGYVRWLAPRMDALKGELVDMHTQPCALTLQRARATVARRSRLRAFAAGKCSFTSRSRWVPSRPKR